MVPPCRVYDVIDYLQSVVMMRRCRQGWAGLPESCDPVLANHGKATGTEQRARVRSCWLRRRLNRKRGVRLLLIRHCKGMSNHCSCYSWRLKSSISLFNKKPAPATVKWPEPLTEVVGVKYLIPQYPTDLLLKNACFRAFISRSCPFYLSGRRCFFA